MPIHLKISLPHGRLYDKSSTGGVCVSNVVAQYASPFEDLTPPWQTYDKSSTGGVCVSNVIAQYANPFEDLTPPWQTL